MAKTVTCFNPSRKESSLIFPAINPPNRASINEACKNSRLEASWDIMGLIKDTVSAPDWLRGVNIMLEIMIIMNRNMTTEK